MNDILLKQILTQKNAKALLNVLIEDSFNIDKEVFFNSYINIEPLLDVTNLLFSLENLKRSNPNFFNGIENNFIKRLEKEYVINSDIISNLMLNEELYTSKILLSSIIKSNLDNHIKTQLFSAALDKFVILDDGFYDKLYKDYDLHLTNKNIRNWNLHYNPTILSSIINEPKLVSDFNSLITGHKMTFILTLLQKEEINITSFKRFINAVNLEDIKEQPWRLSPQNIVNYSALNNKTIYLYKLLNIDVSQMVKKEKLDNFVKYFNEEHVKVLNKILKTLNSSHKPFDEIAVKNYMLKNSGDAQDLANMWDNFIQLVEFRSKKTSQSENFLRLTQNILSQV